MDNYNKFTQTNNMVKGKLYIEHSDDTKEEWSLTIDLSDLWSVQKSLIDFNNEYATALTEQSETIANNCGEMAWNDIEPYAINKLKESTNKEESEKIYDDLYDIYDKHDILLKINIE